MTLFVYISTLIISGVLGNSVIQQDLTAADKGFSIETTLHNRTIISIQGFCTGKGSDGNPVKVEFYWYLEKQPCFEGETIKYGPTSFLDPALPSNVTEIVHFSPGQTATCMENTPLPWKNELVDNKNKTPAEDNHQVYEVIEGTNPYAVAVVIMCAEGTSCDFTSTVEVSLAGPHGYLPAVAWPLLPFYIVMCVVYALYGVLWFFMMACNWKDLLRIQYWIGIVIFIGMLEKALFLAQYEQRNKGLFDPNSRSLVFFAEMISALKRSLARVLVIIVSLGYGIVKPRLGSALQKVVAVGVTFFLLATVEGCLRQGGDRTARITQLADIPLAVLDAVICWWIFTSLLQTTRTLRLRRNVVKLSLYRHFTNTLMFGVLAAVVYMIWTLSSHRFSRCITGWKQLWVDDAFWHILFSILLLIIMILWRPSVNSQRFAFSPLLDGSDDDDDDLEDKSENGNIINEGLGDIKTRNLKTTQVQPKNSKSVDDNLKWIEDNIPSSVADSTLPSLLDSDEEVMTSRYEMSKMD